MSPKPHFASLQFCLFKNEKKNTNHETPLKLKFIFLDKIISIN